MPIYSPEMSKGIVTAELHCHHCDFQKSFAPRSKQERDYVNAHALRHTRESGHKVSMSVTRRFTYGA